ncbi:hypothetical protein QVD17_26626 [Tagetes erecta]|uniref:HMG box domain-containing protein n=1 Tax=Tagetes erecta TaxID=13708 RepID=A0AAD8NQH6_TARER|nr:hypothetical protein QVD17_26626 [Tagetes erecta]
MRRGEVRKKRNVPLGSRNCYQMFIKMETERLKLNNKDPSSARLRGMIEAWKRLSKSDKKPYMEASKKDTERFVAEMAAYEEHKRNLQRHNKTSTSTNAISEFSSSNLVDSKTLSPEALGDSSQQVMINSNEDGDYHVVLEADEDESALVMTNESLVQMAVGLMNNAGPSDPIFQIELDAWV